MTDNYHQNEGNNVNSNTTTMSLLPETNNGNQHPAGNSAQYNQQGYYGMTVSGPTNQNPSDNNQNQYYGKPYYQNNIPPQNNFQPNIVLHLMTFNQIIILLKITINRIIMCYLIIRNIIIYLN